MTCTVEEGRDVTIEGRPTLEGQLSFQKIKYSVASIGGTPPGQGKVSPERYPFHRGNKYLTLLDEA